MGTPHRETGTVKNVRMSVLELDSVTGLPDFEAKLRVPHTPPAAWFTDVPEWFDPNKALIHVKMDGPEEGRVAALVAPWGECILDGKDGCWLPPPSPTAYEFAHVGSTMTDHGDMVRTANVGGGVNHADVRWPMEAAVDHYSNTASRLMRGRYIDTENGIVFLGMMEPGTTRVDALAVMASALSGDWRFVESMDAWEMAGSQLVNNPGFRPVPMRSAQFAVTASMGGSGGVGTVIGNWAMMASPEPDGTARTDIAEEVASLLERLTAAVMPLIAMRTADVPLATRTDDDAEGPEALFDDDWDDDGIADIHDQVFGCNRCGGDGCRHCRHTGVAPYTPVVDDWGYDMSDDLDDITDDEAGLDIGDLPTLDGYRSTVVDVPLLERIPR